MSTPHGRAFEAMAVDERTLQREYEYALVELQKQFEVVRTLTSGDPVDPLAVHRAREAYERARLLWLSCDLRLRSIGISSPFRFRQSKGIPIQPAVASAANRMGLSWRDCSMVSIAPSDRRLRQTGRLTYQVHCNLPITPAPVVRIHQGSKLIATTRTAGTLRHPTLNPCREPAGSSAPDPASCRAF